MKHRITPFLALALLYVTATAQGEWKWAHYWSGQDGTTTSTSYHNYISNSAFDDEGNLYVYGAMGDNPVMDGEPFEFCLEAMYGGQNNPAILLAKFDTLGNMLWYKVVKSSEGNADALWMEVRDDRIIISGSTFALEGVEYYYNSTWLYYMDTLITGTQVHNIPSEERQFPFRPGRYTFFATLDKDGNLLESHFVEAFTRELHPNGSTYIQAPECLCSYMAGTCPFHVDSQGNIHVFTYFNYGGTEDYPYTIVVDGDTNRMYNLFLPGNTDMAISNAMHYKFTPAWTLDFAHLLVPHTDGIATPYELTGDSINPQFECHLYGLSFDVEDNMYLSGGIKLGLNTVSYGGNLHDYPVHIWWDDSHYLTIHDISSAGSANFVIKYNTDGQVVWSNQIYTRKNPNTDEGCPNVLWYNNFFYNNNIYIMGIGAYNADNYSLIYFDQEENYLHRFQTARSDISFFAKYNATNGNYILHGIVPAANAVSGKDLTCVSNRVIGYSNANIYTRTLQEWCDDGTFINTDTIYSSNTLEVSSLSSNDNGFLAIGMTAQAPVSFGNGVSVNCSTERSSAVVALKHDPDLLVPYVKVPEYTGAKPEVRLWPNPATDKITIESEADFPIKSIAITDLQGRLLTVLPGSDVRHTLNIHKLPAGTYIAHIETKAGISDVKFVKGE